MQFKASAAVNVVLVRSRLKENGAVVSRQEGLVSKSETDRTPISISAIWIWTGKGTDFIGERDTEMLADAISIVEAARMRKKSVATGAR